MIRICGLSGLMASFDESEMPLWDIATKVKQEIGIPRGEQQYYHGYTKLSKAILVQGPIEITMVCVRVKCAGCGRKQRKRKYKSCCCLDVHYCGSECQQKQWKSHKLECKASGDLKSHQFLLESDEED